MLIYISWWMGLFIVVDFIVSFFLLGGVLGEVVYFCVFLHLSNKLPCFICPCFSRSIII